MEIDAEALIEKARDAASHAYAPYSKFRVGAALLCDDGRIVIGANVENRSYGLTICAERSAIAAAVSAGTATFIALAVVGIDTDRPLPPCGACRQVITEFLAPDAPVYIGCSTGETKSVTVAQLMPYDSLHELRQDPRS